VVVVVVRWYGGIQLGTGGLTRGAWRLLTWHARMRRMRVR
jgi:hypothetical protein